jgi:hypothetical protein
MPESPISVPLEQEAAGLTTNWTNLTSKAFVLAFKGVANYHGTAAKHSETGVFRSVILSNS